MSKVLILAFYFPPTAASGSLRPAAIAHHLPSFGLEPVVLTAQTDSIYPAARLDNSLDGLLKNDLKVVRLPYKNTLQQLIGLRNRIRGPSAPRGPASSPITPSKTEKPHGLKDRLLDRLFVFPDHQKYWSKPVEHWVRELSDEEKPDVVLATANPWSSLLLAQRIAASLDIPWVADFRDPWFRNPKPQPSSDLLPLVKKRELSVIKSANHVVANTPTLAETLKEDYPEAASKITTITNGFAKQLIPQISPKRSNMGIELCHIGTVYPLRNPKRLLEALARQSEQAMAAQFKIRFLGGWDVQDPETDSLAQSLEDRGIIVRESHVPRETALRRMAEASHLLILQQDFPLQIPAKLYEYIATGKPIIGIGGEGATRTLIESKGLGLCCADSGPAIYDLLDRLLDPATSLPSASNETIEEFEYHQISRKMADVLHLAITTGR